MDLNAEPPSRLPELSSDISLPLSCVGFDLTNLDKIEEQNKLKHKSPHLLDFLKTHSPQVSHERGCLWGETKGEVISQRKRQSTTSSLVLSTTQLDVHVRLE
jgi:hypothetical protein